MDNRIFILAIIFTLFSCKKDSECIHNYGKVKTIYHELSAFDSIEIYADYTDVILMQSDTFAIKINGGENNIKHLEYSSENNIFKIYNNNKCHWLRNYEKRPSVKLHFKNLSKIRNVSESKISNEGDWIANELFIHQNGTGDIEINHLKSKKLWIDTYVKGNVTLQGETQSIICEVKGFGHLYAQNLQSKSALIRGVEEGNAHVFPVDSFDGFISKNSSIYYYNNPSFIITTDSSNGNIQLLTP